MKHLALVGDNLLPPVEEASDIEGESDDQSRTRWLSAAIVHYTGNGLWSIGTIPAADQSKWEWFQDIPIEGVKELLAEAKFRNCPTEKLLERLRDTKE